MAKKDFIVVKRLEEKKADDVLFFTGVICYKWKRLKFLFDLNKGRLVIYKWHKIPKEDIKKIRLLMCSIFHEDIKIKELKLEV